MTINQTIKLRMKFLKKLLIFLGSIIALVLLIALFAKKEYAVEREITVNKGSREVFEYLKLLKNQDSYSVWNMKDPQSKKTYTGTDGTVGFIAAWESTHKEVGIGEQEIIKIDDGKRIDLALRFKEPFEANDNAYFTVDSVGNSQTLVKWGFNGKMPYPMNIMLLFMNFDEMLGNDLAYGLDNAKKILEKQ